MASTTSGENNLGLKLRKLSPGLLKMYILFSMLNKQLSMPRLCHNRPVTLLFGIPAVVKKHKTKNTIRRQF